MAKGKNDLFNQNFIETEKKDLDYNDVSKAISFLLKS